MNSQYKYVSYSPGTIAKSLRPVLSTAGTVEQKKSLNSSKASNIKSTILVRESYNPVCTVVYDYFQPRISALMCCVIFALEALLESYLLRWIRQ